jgi:type IV pilus assembly protein PilQ
MRLVKQIRKSSWRVGRTVASTLLSMIIGSVAHAQPRGMVESVTASEETDGSTSVLIAVSTRPTFTTSKLEQPPRVVIDISGTRLAPKTVRFDAGTHAVGAVAAIASTGDGGLRTRVVLTLRRAADYDVQSSGTRITVRVRPHELPPATSTISREVAAPVPDADQARSAAASAQKVAEQERAAAEVTLAGALAVQRLALESLRGELSDRERILAGAEAEVRRAQRQTEETRRRMDEVMRQEEARSEAARVAAERLQQQRTQFDSGLAAQEEQRRRLGGAEALVSEREMAVERATADLGGRQQAVREALQLASARLADLAKQSVAGRSARNLASQALAAAEIERKTAAAAARTSRQELEQAVAARQREGERKSVLERERQAEEQRLASAVTRRASEEARLHQAGEARRREEGRTAEISTTRNKIEGERARLEAERQVLVSELGRLRTGAALPTATVTAPAPQPPRAILARPQLDRPAAARPLGQPSGAVQRPSITLRAPSRVQRIDFVDEPTYSSVIIDLDEPSLWRVVPAGAGRVSLQLYKTELPRGLERRLDATEYLGPVKAISSYRDPAQRDAVRIDVDMAEEAPNTVRQDGARLTWAFRKSPSSVRTVGEGASAGRIWQASLRWPRKLAGYSNAALAPLLLAQNTPPGSSVRQGASRKRYTGRRIDLDFKGADIHNILRLLADVGSVNIVTSDDVKGEVTIKMRDVPWDQALDVVLRQKQLGQVREGNLIRVAPLAVLEKELEQEIARQKQITEVLPTETRLIGVSYAVAKNLLERGRDLLSPRGKISVDDRTNTLIVSDVGRNLALVEELIRSLDTQTSQVVIEARIVEARSTFVRQIGVQWGGTAFADTLHGNPTGLVFPHNLGIGGGATDGNTPLEGLVPGPRSGTGAANPNFAVNLPAAVGTGVGGALGLTLGSVAGAFNLNLRLSAMESTGQVRILSSPRISTLDNEEASIEQGVSIPISVVSAQGVQTVFVDAKLNLTVKPHVTNDGTVMMDIRVTRNEPDFVNTGARGDPTILKKEATTKMLVRDGDTAVIGGIYQRNSGFNYAKVPFLADIPVLGALFRSRRENDDRTEFLVFITPRIANRARALGQ